MFFDANNLFVLPIKYQVQHRWWYICNWIHGCMYLWMYLCMNVCYMITLYGNSILILGTSSLKNKALSHKSINLSIHLYIDLNIHLIANLCLSWYCQRYYSEIHPSTYQGLSPKLYLRWTEKSECIRRQSLKHSNYHLTLIVQTRITNHWCPGDVQLSQFL